MNMKAGLVMGTSGEEVAALHNALTVIGLQIDQSERDTQSYGASTVAAVIKLQALAGIEQSGVLDENTIVIITGEKDSGLMARAFQAGANLFLFKPVDRMKLLRILRIIQDPMDRARQQSHGGNVRS